MTHFELKKFQVGFIRPTSNGQSADTYNSVFLQESSSLLQPFYPFGIDCFPGGSDGKVSGCNVGDPGSIPGSGRSPGEGNGNPLQHSCLENPMDGGA